MEQVELARRYVQAQEENYDAKLHLFGGPFHSSGYHSTVPADTWVHGTRDNLNYALALLRLKEEQATVRANKVVRVMLTLQETDPCEATYGIWPYLYEEPLAQMSPPDWNWADFNGALLEHMIIEQRDQLEADVEQGILQALGHAGWSIFRRNVGPGYTNIGIMGGAVTVIAGEILSDKRLVTYGRRRLERFVAHTEYHGGFNEYNSPTYTITALHECERTLQLAKDPIARDCAETLRRVAWETICRHYHPGTNQWSGPHSRAYSDLLRANTVYELGVRTGVDIPIHPSMEHEMDVFFSPVEPLPCPEDLRARFDELSPCPVQFSNVLVREEDPLDSRMGTTWMSREVSLGSTNHDDTWVQRRPLIGYWKAANDPAACLRLVFLKNGVEFASAYLRSAQHENRVLTACNLLTDRGDWHCSLDRPKDATFETSEFTLRYQLQAQGATVEDLGEGRYALIAPPYRAVVHTLPGRFAGEPIYWECGCDGDTCWVQAVCYRGPVRKFRFNELADIELAGSVEIVGVDEPLGSAEPMTVVADGILTAVWEGKPRLTVSGPTTPETYK